MPHMRGYEALAKRQIMDPDVEVVVVTGLVPDQERLPGVVMTFRSRLEPISCWAPFGARWMPDLPANAASPATAARSPERRSVLDA